MSANAGVQNTASSAQDELWSELVAMRPKLLAIARRRTSSSQDAEDAVQDALIRIATLAPEDRSKLEGLLVATLTNICVDQHRRKAREHRRSVRLVSRVDLYADQPDEAVCDRAEASWLVQHIGILSRREQEVVDLVAEGHTLHETAARLGVSYKAVHSALLRARATIMAILQAAGAAISFGWLRRQGKWVSASAAAVTAVSLAIVLLPLLTDISGGRLSSPYHVKLAIVHQAHRLDLPQPRLLGNVQHHAVGRAMGGVGQSSSTQQVLSIRPGGPHAGPITVTREHKNETFVQTLQRCVNKGIVVTIAYQGCKP